MKRTKLTAQELIWFRLGMLILTFENELMHVRMRCGIRYALAITHAIRRKDRN